MRKRFLFPGLIIFLAALILICSCPPPDKDDDTPGGGGNPDDPPQAPANVIVARQGLDLKITWSTANGADEYEVLRRYGANGQFTTRTVTAGTSYLDTDFDGSKQIQYAVKSIKDGIPSQGTRSNIISNYVQNITAGLFKSTDSIPLSWDIHPEVPDAYRVYRYTSKDPVQEPVFLGEVAINQFTDAAADPETSPAINTAYFYRVTWIKDGIENGENGPYTFGIYSTKIDTNETGDDKEKAKAIAKNAAALEACIYSFGDGIGGVVADIDWYKYSKPAGSGEMVCLIVHLPKDLPNGSSLDGYMKVRKYDGDTCIDDQGEELFYVAGGQECFLNLGSASEAGYFEIFTTFGSGSSVVKEYSVELE